LATVLNWAEDHAFYGTILIAECGMRSAECGVRNAECGMKEFYQFYKKWWSEAIQQIRNPQSAIFRAVRVRFDKYKAENFDFGKKNPSE
jgi:hypothetical protein